MQHDLELAAACCSVQVSVSTAYQWSPVSETFTDHTPEEAYEQAQIRIHLHLAINSV